MRSSSPPWRATCSVRMPAGACSTHAARTRSERLERHAGLVAPSVHDGRVARRRELRGRTRRAGSSCRSRPLRRARRSADPTSATSASSLASTSSSFGAADEPALRAPACSGAGCRRRRRAVSVRARSSRRRRRRCRPSRSRPAARCGRPRATDRCRARRSAAIGTAGTRAARRPAALQLASARISSPRDGRGTGSAAIWPSSSATASADRRASISASARSSTVPAWISVSRAISPSAHSSPTNSSSAGPFHSASACCNARHSDRRRRPHRRRPGRTATRRPRRRARSRCSRSRACPCRRSSRTRETDVRSAPGEISSTSASHSDRKRRGECSARIASSRRWLALGRSISDPSVATACTPPRTRTLAIAGCGSLTGALSG